MISLLLCWILAYFFISLSPRLVSPNTGSDQGTSFLVALSVFTIGAEVWSFFLPLKWFLPLTAVLALTALFTPAGRLWLKDQGHWLEHRFFVILLLSVLLFSAALPSFINDDSSYYQQTLKWLNGYGLVPGLANLNIRLGLSSGWHLVCSVFYLDGEWSRFYNLNGLLLFTVCIGLWQEGQRGVIASIPVLLAGALFLNAPSPDLLVLCGTFWFLYKFNHLTLTEKVWIVALLISTKPSAAALVLFLIPGLLDNGKKEIVAATGILLLSSGITAAKNMVLTGYPLFPIAVWPDFDISWKIPVEQLTYFKQNVLNEIFDSHVRGSVEQTLTLKDQLRLFFELRTYKQVMMLASLISFVGIAFYFFKRGGKQGPVLFMLVLISGAFWLLTAPNYRYALGFIAFFLGILVLWIWDRAAAIRSITWPLMSLSLAVVLGINLLADRFLFVVRCGQSEPINASIFLLPVDYPSVSAEKKQEKDLLFYDPADCLYCSDTPVPCYPDSIRHMHRSEGYQLNLRDTGQLGSGFIQSDRESAR